jgi:hypothetical protein
MNNTITRNIISKNFRARNFLKNKGTVSRKRLISLINLWKYLLVYKCNAKKGESILIGIVSTDTEYLAICLAAAELSLKIVVNDNTRKYSNTEYIDPKTKLLAPINIHLYDVPDDDLPLLGSEKINFFIKWSDRSYSIDKLDKKIDRNLYRKSSKIFPSPKDIIMKCTSSGTTGTPKIIEHTHEFLYKLSFRNSKRFKGKCLHIRNLHHGSSFGSFLLPSLINDNVNEHLFHWFDGDEWVDEFIENISSYTETLEFILFPYPFMIHKFISYSKSLNLKWPNLEIHTLSYIQDISKNSIREEIFKSITSQFGSNETGGPIFECTIDKNNLDQLSNKFKKVDDFYSTNFDKEDLIEVIVPTYEKSIITNDKFKQEDGYYIHQGRSDLIKINGEIVDIKIINEINEKYQSIFLVTDSIKNCLYLAYWDKEDIELFKSIDQDIKNKFKKINISKTAVLKKKNFLTGIKIDNELLREYFRNYC